MAFDVITPIKIGQVAIGITNTSVGTAVPASTRWLVKNIDIANTTAASITVIVYAGDGTATSNILIPDVTIPANGIFQWSGVQVLNASDAMVAIASATGCTITASGGEAV
jgi:hypothetical protein